MIFPEEYSIWNNFSVSYSHFASLETLLTSFLIDTGDVKSFHTCSSHWNTRGLEAQSNYQVFSWLFWTEKTEVVNEAKSAIIQAFEEVIAVGLPQ